MITITENAAFFIQAMLERDPVKKGIRICLSNPADITSSPLLMLTESSAPDDATFCINGLQIFTPCKTLYMIDGLVIDYKHNQVDSGFSIYNPNATL